MTKQDFLLGAIQFNANADLDLLESKYAEIVKRCSKDKSKATTKALTTTKVYDANSFELQTATAFILHKSKTVKWSTLFKGKDMQKIEQSWADEVRKLKDIDWLTEEQITEICKFAIEDNFWKENIVSVMKLRNKNPEWIKYWAVLADKLIWQKTKKQSTKKLSNF